MEKMLVNNIAVSILNAENKEKFLSNLKKTIQDLGLNNISAHIDVMDGKFVKETGVELKYAKVAKELDFFVDVHLMVEKPIKYIDEALKYGADNITVHLEIGSLKEVLEYLNKLKNEKKLSSISIAVKPDTKLEKLKEYLDYIDMVLLMTVEPGKGMQKYIEKVENKMLELKDSGKILQVDGGINEETIIRAKKCNVNSFVVGSYLTKNETQLKERLEILNSKVEG